MAAVLKSISATIPWWLAVKPIAFGILWLLAPRWIFLPAAFVIYFFPPFEAGRLLPPFLAVVGFAILLPPAPWIALYLAVTLGLILGIKDLIFINRRAAYETALFLLLALGALVFFEYTERVAAPSLFWAFVGLALLVLFLYKSFFEYLVFGKEEGSPPSPLLLSGLLTFLGGGLALGLLFTPLNSFFQAALFFASGVSATELFSTRLGGALGRREILVHLSLGLILWSAALAAHTWSI